MVSNLALDSFGDSHRIAVERVLAEFRAARPVAIKASGQKVVAIPVEGLTARLTSLFKEGGRNPRLIVPNEKVKAPAIWGEAAAAVLLSPFSVESIAAYLDFRQGKEKDGARASIAELRSPDECERAALAVAKLSLLLPAAIVVDASKAELDTLPLLGVDAEHVIAFRDEEAKSLEIVTRTFVPLDGAGQCEFVVFRGGDGFRDQVAVIVSDPSPRRPVLTRIHSACLTGDLFGSLKCDCGDQLRGTVRVMSEQGGGIVLYLDQEGRGNGIANKIRAYSLQNEGFDTYDADKLIGFGPDQRRFDFAAEMLKQLGYSSIRLMTNNPQKIDALRAAGLDVVSTHRVLIRPTLHNASYLAAKRDKGGHLLGDTALDGVELEDLIGSAVPQP